MGIYLFFTKLDCLGTRLGAALRVEIEGLLGFSDATGGVLFGFNFETGGKWLVFTWQTAVAVFGIGRG